MIAFLDLPVLTIPSLHAKDPQRNSKARGGKNPEILRRRFHENGGSHGFRGLTGGPGILLVNVGTQRMSGAPGATLNTKANPPRLG